MKPVKTETSNITFIGEGCQDLPGTRYPNGFEKERSLHRKDDK